MSKSSVLGGERNISSKAEKNLAWQLFTVVHSTHTAYERVTHEFIVKRKLPYQFRLFEESRDLKLTGRLTGNAFVRGMGINPMKWKTRHAGYSLLGLFLLYVLFIYKKTHQVMFDATIVNSNPMHVWEFVADFSNMKKLNPTIEDFNVIAESGNYDHWKYSVKYTEHLSHLPLIRNTAHGHFAVRPDKNGYLISSKHRTCFLLNLYCLDSVSQFRFDPDGEKDTKCIETVQYECPIAFSAMCSKEVMYQRREIMSRLKDEFSIKKQDAN